MNMKWTKRQMMAVRMAREIKNGKTYITGTGLPLIAVSLAKNMHAPDACVILETGYIDPTMGEVPTSVSDLRVTSKTSVIWPQYSYFGYQKISSVRGQVEAGIIGGAQIDPFGNLNSTCIGDYWAPDHRFTGSGGANGIATYCNTFIVMKHEKKRFSKQVDYVTSPGWIDGPDGREKVGLPPNHGPRLVITEMGVMRFDEKTKRIYLAEHYPDVSIEEIVENTGFEMDVSKAVESEPPTNEEMTLLLEKIDPQRFMI